MNTARPNGRGQEIRLPLNIAIVGGGRACRFFLEYLDRETLPYLQIHLVGVCDIDPQAEGLRRAREMGIFTTDDYRDFFNFEKLDGIIELTNSRQVLLDLIHARPKQVGIIEHNIGRFIRRLFVADQRLKSAERQVAMEQMLSAFLIRQARQRIVVLNTDFTIAEANDAYLEGVNRRREEVVGEPCYRIIRGMGVPCSSAGTGIECPMVETLRTGESAHIIHEDPSVSDRPTYIDIVTYPVTDAAGEIIRIIEIWRDITREMATRVDERVSELKSDLNKLVQEDRLISLGKLVASCVHEINNPIQGLLTFSHLIADTLAAGPPEAEELENLRQISAMMCEELERCGKIVSGLLSFSRQTAMAYSDLDLNETLEAVTALTGHKMHLQDIRLEVDLCPRLLIVNGDANRLQQCFLNLVFNAIEAMPSGGTLTVRSRAEDQGGCALVEIRDSGYGIPERHRTHIFDPFFTTKEAGEGTGLGLSIVYGVVKNHGGDITVESREGRGTAFMLRLPMAG